MLYIGIALVLAMPTSHVDIIIFMTQSWQKLCKIIVQASRSKIKLFLLR